MIPIPHQITAVQSGNKRENMNQEALRVFKPAKTVFEYKKKELLFKNGARTIYPAHGNPFGVDEFASLAENRNNR